jgi:regulator of protease activity HflC (stomatin/prohibitin superfamily)
MVNPLPFIVFAVFALIGYLVSGVGPDATPVQWAILAAFAAVGGLIASAIKIAAQWEKALVFRLGKFKSVKGPGIFSVLPFFDSVKMVDTRIFTLDIPTQQAITKDNVPVSLDAVIFLRVESPAEAVIRVQQFQHAIRQYAQAALRDIVGAMTLDEILADRESVGKQIETLVEGETQGWGLEVAGIRIQDIVLPEDLKRVMARQAAAEREKRANITKSEGDREAAENLAAAAERMATSPGALQLRTLQSLDSLGSSAANTVVLAIPIEIVNALNAVPKIAETVTQRRSSEDDAKLDRKSLSSAPAPATRVEDEAQLENR